MQPPSFNPIQLQLTLDDTNLILEALGQMPYYRVHQLIGKIHHQATMQLDGSAARLEATVLPSENIPAEK